MEILGGATVSGNLEIWMTGGAQLVGMPSAVVALSGDRNGHHHIVPSKCAQSTGRHPSSGLTGSCTGTPPPFTNPESSLDGHGHSPMRLFNSFTSSCLRISLIRGHTWATNTERRIRPGTRKRKLESLRLEA